MENVIDISKKYAKKFDETIQNYSLDNIKTEIKSKPVDLNLKALKTFLKN